MKVAVLNDASVVVNLVEADSLDVLPEVLLVEAGGRCEIGWKYDQATGTFLAPPVPMKSLDELRIETARRANEIARQKRDQVVAGISPAEMASWSIKRAEALAYQSSSNTADAPSLLLEAQARGVPLVDLAGKVLTKAAQLAALEAAIAGRCGAVQDAAAAAQSEAELLAIDLEAGWPV